MTSDRTLLRALATRLVVHAGRALPRSRSSWAAAMARELEHVEDDWEAVEWSIGCVWASYSEKTRTMQMQTGAVSRWVLGCEMLLCFAPLTLLFIAVLLVFGDGTLPAGDAWWLLSAGAVGPLGLIVSASALARPRMAPQPAAVVTLVIASSWTLLAFSAGIAVASAGPIGEWWREFVLIALLPAVGSAHLLAIAARSGRTATTD